MSELVTVPAGGYRYLPGVFQYSAAVVAEPGWEIERARFREPVSLADGFRVVEEHLASLGRPLLAFCACELRSPEPFTEAGFFAFNRLYANQLASWRILSDSQNPVARSNVCPEVRPPVSPSFYAFSYTVPRRDGTLPSFLVAGSGEAPEGKANYRDHIIRLGDTSVEGLREKARYVLEEMERRMRALGVRWADVTATQLYTVLDVYPILADEIVGRGATPGGLTWHLARPPVVGIDFEMDVRGVAREIII
jgi:hypothetical protein